MIWEKYRRSQAGSPRLNEELETWQYEVQLVYEEFTFSVGHFSGHFYFYFLQYWGLIAAAMQAL
jgi:hypothetical protein